MKTTIVVEFRGSLAWTPFESKIKRLFGRNLDGSGFSFLTGKRDISATYKNKAALQRKIEEIKALGKQQRAKVKIHLYEDED